MNLMKNKTPEERKAISLKSVATRRENREIRKKENKELAEKAARLMFKIDELEQKLRSLERVEAINMASASLTGKVLLRQEEISSSALPWSRASGVYFLLDGEEIVYIGQSVNVYSRIAQHTDKMFDRYAFVPCPVESLNTLESLYIHCLRPRLNGKISNDAMHAPVFLERLLGAF